MKAGRLRCSIDDIDSCLQQYLRTGGLALGRGLRWQSGRAELLGLTRACLEIDISAERIVISNYPEADQLLVSVIRFVRWIKPPEAVSPLAFLRH